MEHNVAGIGMDDENVSLLKFLYACPVGLLEIRGDGEISMINPLAMQVLLPLTQGLVVENLFFIIVGSSWTDTSTPAEIEAANEAVTWNLGAKLRSISPGSGTYLNEADVAEPNFQQAFWGANYDRLLAIKKSVDPWDTFWAPTAVGSEKTKTWTPKSLAGLALSRPSPQYAYYDTARRFGENEPLPVVVPIASLATTF